MDWNGTDGPLLRRRRRADVDGGDDGHQGQRRTLAARRHRRKTIASACPFCFIMIDDGVKGAGKEEDEVRVGDISMHVLEAIEAGEQAEVERLLQRRNRRGLTRWRRFTTLCSLSCHRRHVPWRLGGEGGAGRGGTGPEAIGGQALIEGVMMRPRVAMGARRCASRTAPIRDRQPRPPGRARRRSADAARAGRPRPRRVGRPRHPGDGLGGPGPSSPPGAGGYSAVGVAVSTVVAAVLARRRSSGGPGHRRQGGGDRRTVRASTSPRARSGSACSSPTSGALSRAPRCGGSSPTTARST